MHTKSIAEDIESQTKRGGESSCGQCSTTPKMEYPGKIQRDEAFIGCLCTTWLPGFLHSLDGKFRYLALAGEDPFTTQTIIGWLRAGQDPDIE